MNDAKHTKGPWHLDPDGYCEYIWGPNNEMVAQIRGVGADLPREANAHLIAAAPDLLEALRNCVRVLLAPRNACPELMITVGKLAQETIDAAEGK